MAAFIKFFRAFNLEIISTYFFLIQHSEHISVLLQLPPCPKVKKKKKMQHLLLQCFCNQTYHNPQKTQTSPICTLLQLRKIKLYKTQKRLKKGWQNTGVLLCIKAVWRRSQPGTTDSKKNKLQLDTETGSLRAWVPALVLLLPHQGPYPSSSRHKAWTHLVSKQHTTTMRTSPKICHFHFTWLWVGAEVSHLFLHVATIHKGFALTFPEICSNSARNSFSSSNSCGLGVGIRGCNINHTNITFLLHVAPLWTRDHSTS